jgi:hypothetical protein
MENEQEIHKLTASSASLREFERHIAETYEETYERQEH